MGVSSRSWPGGREKRVSARWRGRVRSRGNPHAVRGRSAAGVCGRGGGFGVLAAAFIA